MRRWFCVVVTGGLLLAACGGGGNTGSETDAEAADAGRDGPSPTCASDDDCDDGRYCNGVETCSPGAEGADDRGCVAGEAPCGEDGDCNEETDSCGECDADGDGHMAVACGGDDCDDDDPDRFPGNTEVCDSAGIDEDCDPSTLGHDMDGDGYVDQECCNQQPDGSMLCGADCDDENRDVHPDALDRCGNGDEDCDGEIDEDPNETYYRDADDDGYGVESDSTVACSAPDGYALLAGDCDDDDRDINPGVDERCDADFVDENCDGMANVGCDCTAGDTRDCGPDTDEGACEFGTQSCILDGDGGSVWGTCTDAVEPSSEVCNGVDDDCDGEIDNLEGAQCVYGETETGTNMCGREGTRSCEAPDCRWSPPDFSRSETEASCDYCDDTGEGYGAEAAVATRTESSELPGGVTHFQAGDGVTTRAYFTDPLDIGYGTVTFRTEIRAYDDSAIHVTPDDIGHGWALVLAKEDTVDPNPLLGQEGWRLGVPWGRDGLSVEWRFYDVDGSVDDEADSLLLRHITDGGLDPELARADTVMPHHDSSVTTDDTDQELRITIEPALPDGPNDTQVVVEYFHSSEWHEALACGGAAPDCPFRIAAGESYHFGLTNSLLENNSMTLRASTIERRGLCP